MAFERFDRLKPTWETVDFDEATEAIPRTSRGWRGFNPIDPSVLLLFIEKNMDFVYYLPKTGKVYIGVKRFFHKDDRELNEIFGERISGIEIRREKGIDEPAPTIISEMVIGSCFVYRLFEVPAECSMKGSQEYSCGMLPLREIKRYVFSPCGVIVEYRDNTRTLTTAENIDVGKAYDTIYGADNIYNQYLYRAFAYDADIPHKEDIVGILPRVKKDFPKFALRVFKEIYAKATEREYIPENVPERIVNELNGRSHDPGIAVRIARDLVVVTGESKNDYLECGDQTRAYFDRNAVWYFRKNAVTGKWTAEDLYECVAEKWEAWSRYLDRGFFKNTCMENLAKYAIDKKFPTRSKINLEHLFAEYFFLSAEQAAKIDSPVFDVIVKNIYAGKLVDRKKPLAELLGVTGGYIQSMAAGRCTILFLRDNKDINTPLITIEVREQSIRQCYGFRDTHNHNPQIRDFIMDYASSHGFKIDAVIYSEKK